MMSKIGNEWVGGGSMLRDSGGPRPTLDATVGRAAPGASSNARQGYCRSWPLGSKWLAVIGTVASLSIAANGVNAADGAIDIGFGQGGRQIVSFDAGGQHVDRAFGMATAPSGEIFLAGYVHNSGTETAIGLARLTPQGQVDAGYGQPIHAVKGFDSIYVTDAALQPDGKFVVAGYGQRASGRDMVVCRFRVDGGIDPLFGNAPTPGCRVMDILQNDMAQSVAIQPDGRIVLAGTARADINRAVVVRLDTSGQPDPTFGAGGIRILLPGLAVGTSLLDVAIAPGGDLIAAGHVRLNAGDDDWMIFRLKAKDGGFDPSFDNGGIKQVHFDKGPMGARSDYARSIAVTPTGSIFIAGHVQSAPGIYCMAAIRLAPNGSFSAFGQGGIVTDSVCESGLETNDLALQPDGRLVLATKASSGDFQAIRLTPTGVIDGKFGTGGRARVAFDLVGKHGIDVATRLVASANHVLLAGYAERQDDGYDYAVTRLTSGARR